MVSTIDILREITHAYLWFFLDDHLDLDVETLWSDFPDAPTPPPPLAASQWLSMTPSYEKPLPGSESEYFIESIFYPSYESKNGFSWPGPDPLSYGTSADDIFLYASAFLLLERVNWLEFRLCSLNGVNEVTDQFLFFVPRFESILGNLNRVRAQIYDVIIQQDRIQRPGPGRFQLLIYPRQEAGPVMVTRSVAPPLNSHPSFTSSSLDPVFFVHNIVGGCSYST